MGIDLDNKGYINEEDLIIFYKNSAKDPHKLHVVWENLNEYHYRNDLKLRRSYRRINWWKNVS